jgi:hypothetical protein
MLLQLAELLNAVRSPLAAIEDQNHRFNPAMVAQGDNLILGVRQREIRRFIADFVADAGPGDRGRETKKDEYKQ